VCRHYPADVTLERARAAHGGDSRLGSIAARSCHDLYWSGRLCVGRHRDRRHIEPAHEVLSLSKGEHPVGQQENKPTMPDAREVRRICGFLVARTHRLHLGQIPDQRDQRGRRWSLSTLVLASLLGMMTGQHGFADVERLTDKLPRAIRRRLGILRRVADTTLRDAHATLDPSDLRPVLHSQVRSAHVSKSLRSDFDLPFGVVAMDGKYVTVPAVDDKYSQRTHRDTDQGPLRGRIGTMTAVLTSSEARPCVDVYPIAAATNEMGTFSRALDSLLEAYGQLDLFRLVTYDAGACSMANAQTIRDRRLHYLFRLKGSQPELSTAASLWLGCIPKQQADAVSVDSSGKRQVTRRVFLRACTHPPEGWEHLRTVIRVDSESFDRLGRPVEESFYFLSSLPIDRLSPEQWLTIIRRHWGVETAQTQTIKSHCGSRCDARFSSPFVVHEAAA
jgi:hypothetical protein